MNNIRVYVSPMHQCFEHLECATSFACSVLVEFNYTGIRACERLLLLYFVVFTYVCILYVLTLT